MPALSAQVQEPVGLGEVATCARVHTYVGGRARRVMAGSPGGHGSAPRGASLVPPRTPRALGWTCLYQRVG